MSHSSTEDDHSLYDPPTQEAKEIAAEVEEKTSVSLELSAAQARQLRTLSQHLGLPITTVASRAIELVCDEITTVKEEDEPPADHMIENYQAQLDLLHSVDAPSEDGTSTLSEEDPIE